MEELTGKWARLSLNTRECQTIPLAPGVENNSKILVAKLFTKRRVSMEALSRTLKSMWRSIKDFEVRDLTSNTVLILFSDEADAVKIISQGPWSFDKYLIGLYKPSVSESVDDARFDTTTFWLQIHNLPLSRMNRANAEAIGSSLGRVEQVDTSPNGECRGRCIWIRVTIDITQPLYRGRFVDLGDSEPLWVSFQYERMPVFCYWCGLMNHDEKDCKLWTDIDETLSKDTQQYGPWLKAAMINPQQPQVVHTKTTPSTAPPSTHRPTPSPTLRPSPLMDSAQNLPKNPPSSSPMDSAQNPPKNPPSSSPIENLVISAPHPENVPTNKDILSDPNLFRTHLTEIDQALNSFQNLNKQTPPTQLANTSVTNIPKSPSTCPPKSTTTEKETNIALMTHQPDTLSTITDHVTSSVHKNFSNSTRSTSLDPVGPQTGSWRRLGPPRQIMDTNGPNIDILGSKRKNSDEVIMRDTLDDKKQKILDDEARTLGKLKADNLGSAVAAWQHHRTQ
uniref:DUF4283 domain-containing protein n=1 Tax=Quercus lobata TaxID=97700 RepID=A0A7N2LPN5_QUELO